MKRPLVYPLDRNSNKEAREMADFYEETLGFTPNSLFTMMHRPRIAKAFLEMNQAVMENKGRLTSSLKRQLAYLASMTAGCRYCEAHAVRAAVRYGSDEDELNHIWEYKTYPAFSDAERAVFDFAIAAASVPNAVDDALSEKLRQYWDEGEIVEILGVVALFGYLNRWNDSMGTQLEEPAAEDGDTYLSAKGWSRGKHAY
ncbi:carboxymuconolactone decarboxylase family protein [Pelagicoccus mobilis]|uniref:Carboxymuconolactone decarboxylase family protein n=1 Tax=Pelagicoccus mobilis TaxID=415221 RepID=A0A934VSD6_9BACT|nr:carboxymuconolactone decarboxylase family protein [Pelagicoccus mobilis]MBK1880327.1 carboxymuconolactone decarboxylase family protein [Pelagicoccus mobilis]